MAYSLEENTTGEDLVCSSQGAAGFTRTMSNMLKDFKDKIETFGRELESIQKRNLMEILELRDAVNRN